MKITSPQCLLTVVMMLGIAAPWRVASADDRVAELVAMLDSRHWEAAVEELVGVGEPVVDTLIDVARSGQSRRSQRACEALTRIGTERATSSVIAIAHDPDSRQRAGAVAALGFATGDRVIEVLVDALAGDSEWSVRRNAAVSLGRIGSKQGLAALEAALGDKVEYVRGAAAEALGRLADGSSVPSLAGRLGDESTFVSDRVRDALVAIGEAAVEPLSRLCVSQDARLRWRTTWVLARIDSAQTVSILDQALGDPDWMVRNEAATAAATRQGQGVVFYPLRTASRPSIPSPWTTLEGIDIVVARAPDEQWAVVPARPSTCERRMEQSEVDAHDFPTLARTGVHDERELQQVISIGSRSLAEITLLGRPGALSTAGFMAADEDIVSVLIGDNRVVSALGLTHPQLARPLLDVWNIVLEDSDAGRWNMAAHRWEQLESIVYNGRTVSLAAGDTKGGQESIFDDGLEGAFWIEIDRALTPPELEYLHQRYPELADAEMETLIRRLSHIQTGEMEPHYIVRYGFYEGHTEWRTDPVAIALIFGLKSLPEIEAAFPGRLDQVMTDHFARQ